jgi:hypothetical protein
MIDFDPLGCAVKVPGLVAAKEGPTRTSLRKSRSRRREPELLPRHKSRLRSQILWVCGSLPRLVAPSPLRQKGRL